MTAEAARLEIEDNEAHRLTAGEMDGASAHRVQISKIVRVLDANICGRKHLL
jgi:hypothetical protein